MFSKLSIATLLCAVTLAASATGATPAAKPAAPAAKPAAPAPKATAPQAKPAAPAAKAAEPQAKEQVVCTTEHTLGSHLPKRTCMTEAARDERAKRDQEAMRNMHDSPKALKGGS